MSGLGGHIKYGLIIKIWITKIKYKNTDLMCNGSHEMRFHGISGNHIYDVFKIFFVLK